jgi:mono/diheme cytochrome c family protein
MRNCRNESTPLVGRNVFENRWHSSTSPFLAWIGSPIGLQLFAEIEILHDLSGQSRATRHREFAAGRLRLWRPRLSRPARAADADVKAGARVYKDNCETCHGEGLHNNSGIAFDLRRLHADEHDRFVNSGLNGKNATGPAGRTRRRGDRAALELYPRQRLRCRREVRSNKRGPLEIRGKLRMTIEECVQPRLDPSRRSQP